ncbi:hypothetical protein C8R47DRAFT_1190063 [Mycena vitilis]|nr:hypothetical protein C8R47DRAFT_1190063 [Mycena vitilis]
MTISHRLKRAARTDGPVKKKTLLIGIGYKDVLKVREFLINAGHNVQVPELPTAEHTELDGLDEGTQTTFDKSLPAKASLVAILDTCHSASLLDLDHGKCNQKWNCHDTAQHRKPVSLRDSGYPGPSRVALPSPLKKIGPRAAVMRETEIMPERQFAMRSDSA